MSELGRTVTDGSIKSTRNVTKAFRLKPRKVAKVGPDENTIIFDPSLLIPPSHLLFREISKDHKILVPPKMHEILFNRKGNKSDMQNLLRFWGGKAEEVPLCIEWLEENLRGIRTETNRLSSAMNDFRIQHVISPLRKYVIDDEPNLQFVTNTDELVQCISEQICLALQYDPTPVPIMCSETSSWKIVEIMRKCGAKIKDEVLVYTERKRDYFNENWKKVLSKTMGAAFIWAWGGPMAGLGALGVMGITIAIEDP